MVADYNSLKTRLPKTTKPNSHHKVHHLTPRPYCATIVFMVMITIGGLWFLPLSSVQFTLSAHHLTSDLTFMTSL